MSKLVYYLHFFCLLLFVTCSTWSPAIKAWFPTFFAAWFLPVWGIISAGTFLSWPVFGGCPFTKLENRFLIREGKPTYGGQCIGHYLALHTGIRLKGLTVNLILVGLMVLPLAVYFL